MGVVGNSIKIVARFVGNSIKIVARFVGNSIKIVAKKVNDLRTVVILSNKCPSNTILAFLFS